MQSNDEAFSRTPQEPSDLVAEVVSSLRAAKETDTELLEILSRRILTMTPSQSAVADALSDIQNLASMRADRPEDD